MLSPGEVEILMTYNMDLLHQKTVLTPFLVHVLYEQKKKGNIVSQLSSLKKCM